MNNNYVLPDNLALQRNNALLTFISNPNGPFSRRIFDPLMHGFKTIENMVDVIVGDFANTGNKQGSVTAATNAGGILTITVKYTRTKQPGESLASFRANPLEEVVYKFANVAAASAGAQRVVYQKYDNPGVLFYRPVNAVPETNPLFTLVGTPAIAAADASETITVQNGGVDFQGASVQLTVNGVNVGSPVLTDVNGEATFTRDYLLGELIRFVVSASGYNTITFGPYTVSA